MNNKGDIKRLIPREDSTLDIRLNRKSHNEIYKLKWNDNMIGVVLEASNDKNFKFSDTLSIITETTINSTYDVKINSAQKYRYYRVSARKNDIAIYLSKLSFRDKDELNVNGILFDSRTSIADFNNIKLRSPQIAISELLQNNDNNLYATAYGWFGVDFHTPVQLTSVHMLIRNDGNGIYPENNYELLYHDKQEWISLGIKIANDTFIEYDNVPSGALYWLRNHTEGKEERIFTYENGKMKFW